VCGETRLRLGDIPVLLGANDVIELTEFFSNLLHRKIFG
jgi:hypothetical protein